MRFIKKRNPLNLLEMVPLLVLTDFSETDNKITLHIAKFKNQVLSSLLVPKHKTKTINIRLDIYGSGVWKLIDGKRTIQEICDQLRTTLPDGEPSTDLEERTAKFITELNKSRFIKLMEEKSCQQN
jgi:hypothetical protein